LLAQFVSRVLQIPICVNFVFVHFYIVNRNHQHYYPLHSRNFSIYSRLTIGGGAYWAARPLFGPNGQAMLIALPLLQLQNKNAFALDSSKPNLLSPDAIYEQKMHQNAFSAGALSRTPLGSLQSSPDP